MKKIRKKKQSLLQISLIISAFIPSIVSQTIQGALYQETFNTGINGWHYGYGTSYTIGSTFLESTGGNPGAHIHGTANDLSAVWIDSWGTSDSLIPYGDLNGLTMTIDTKITGTASGTAQFYVGRGGKYFVMKDGWDISQDTTWTTHTAVLDETDFKVWGNHTTPLSYILEKPDDIGIFFGGSTVSADNNAQILIDNFGSTPTIIVAVPEPSSYLFLSGAALLLLFKRQRIQK